MKFLAKVVLLTIGVISLLIEEINSAIYEVNQYLLESNPEITNKLGNSIFSIKKGE